MTGVSACRCILDLLRLDVEIASVQVGNTLFLPHPIVEIAAIDQLHHDLELPAIFARRIQVNAVRQTMTLQFGMPR